MRRLLLLAILVLAVVVVLFLVWRRALRRAPGPPPHPAAEPPAAQLAWLLFVLPLPVAAAAAVSLARGLLVPLFGNLVAYGLFVGGAWLVRRGLAPGRPRLGRAVAPKTLGIGLVATATGLTAWLGAGHPPAVAAVFALVACGGCALTYGLDLPVRRRLGRGLGEQARAALDQADRSIAAIEEARGSLRQAELDARLGRIAALAREILADLEEDPRDLWRARKFLNVYLDGVQRVVEGYAQTHARIDAPQLDLRFRQALVTVEDAFREQRQRLLERDVEDLDVQIEVLTKQLEREGIV